jgi:hypothetical protein
MKKGTLFIALIILFAAGCTITQEYHFNKDLSGNYSLEMNVEELIGFMESMDTTGNMSGLDSMDQSFLEMSEKYKENGAKNVQAGWKEDKTTIFVSFDFDDISTLNNILNNSSGSDDLLSFGASSEPAEFANKGMKKLSINMPEYSNDTLNMNEMGEMSNYLNFETIFSFDRTIKKIDNQEAVLSDDKKSFKFEGNLDKFLDENFSMDTNIKLKSK